MAEDLILLCEEELRQAQLAGDVATLERLLDDALMFTTREGDIVGKSDDLSLHRSRRLRISRMEPSDRHVLHLGSVAVVSVRMEAAASLDGTEVRSALRYTRVWCERAGGWRVIAGHMSTASR